MKNCFKCGKEKPLTEFYRHSKMADGHLNKCKSCAKTDSQINFERNMRDPQRFEMELERQRVKQRKKKIIIGTKEKTATIARYARRYPEKIAAHKAVKIALSSGDLKRKPCEKCSAEKAQAHHEDYSKPLDVNWLCSTHHAERHVEIRKQKRLGLIS
jgi:hypothetical protein